MSADEFWKDDPQLFVSYRTSFLNKKQREFEEEDYKSWLKGLYVHNGNGLLFNSLKQFIYEVVSGKKDNTKLDTYPAKPYFELEREKKVKKELDEKQKKYEQFENDLVYFGTLKQQYLNKLNKKNKK